MHFEGNAGTENENNEAQETVKPSKLTEELYIFRPGMIPPYRQMFYQYCDIHVEEIQKLLERSILNGGNPECTEKNGWLPTGVEAECRDIISSLVEKTLAERRALGKDTEVCSDDDDSETSATDQIIEDTEDQTLDLNDDSENQNLSQNEDTVNQSLDQSEDLEDDQNNTQVDESELDHNVSKPEDMVIDEESL